MLLNIEEPSAVGSKKIFGIDLGTTHSLIAFADGFGNVTVIPDENGKRKILSVVSYGENSSNVQKISSVKRLLGKSLTDSSTQDYKKHFPDLNISGDDVSVSFEISSDDKITPLQVSADILVKLKKQAESYFKRNNSNEIIEDVVITVPAYFDDAQRQATKDAGKLAGLNVVRLLNEPTAAAVAYGLNNGENCEGKTFLIYDFGGGTFDVSILKFSQGVFRVLATGGDSYLGGDDIDYALAKILNCDLSEARIVKEQASLSQLKAIKQASLLKASLPFLQKTIAICEEVLYEADISTEQLEKIILVGGSSRMPMVSELLAEKFNLPVEFGLNPDEVVAQGAALHAYSLGGGCNSDILLMDISPLSLGIETMGDIVDVIIPRNTAIPITKTQFFTTFKDNQDAMDIHVVQGEGEHAKDCRSLAKFRLSDIPAMASGEAKIQVVFALDADGILTVTAQEITMQKPQTIEVVPSYGLSQKEMVKMLTKVYN